MPRPKTRRGFALSWLVFRLPDIEREGVRAPPAKFGLGQHLAGQLGNGKPEWIGLIVLREVLEALAEHMRAGPAKPNGSR